MINIEYASPADGEHILTVSGHAGYAEAGKDIVCAGVSALVYGAAGALEHRGVSCAFRDDEEGITLHVRATADADFTDGVFAAAVAGLDQIAESYPDYVTF